MRNTIATISLFLLPFLGLAQKVIKQEEQFLYQREDHAFIDHFDREFIPLDGAVVPYIPCRKDDLYGFVDKKTKEWKIKPKYTQVIAAYPDGAIVEYEGRFGLVNYNDTFILAPYFLNLFKEGDIYHGLLSSSDTSIRPSHLSSYTYNLYCSKNKFLFQAKSHRQRSFSAPDTMAWFRYADTFSVYGKSGALIKKIPFDKNSFIGIFNNCLVHVALGANFTGFRGYSPDGTLLYTLPLSDVRGIQEVYRLNDTMFALISDEDGIQFVNHKGAYYPFSVSNRMVFPSSDVMYDNAVRECLYKTGVMVVTNTLTGLSGLLSRDGSFKIPCKYKWLGQVVNGEFPFIDNATGKIGFMNTDGKITVPAVLSAANTTSVASRYIQPFCYSEGLCATVTGLRKNIESNDLYVHSCGYADRTGKIVISLPDSIVFAANFSGGLAAIYTQSGRLGFINKKGKLVIPLKYEPAVIGAYPFPQIIIPAFINGYAYIKSWKGYIDSTGYEYFSGKRMEDHYNFSH